MGKKRKFDNVKVIWLGVNYDETEAVKKVYEKKETSSSCCIYVEKQKPLIWSFWSMKNKDKVHCLKKKDKPIIWSFGQ